ncbi:MAG: ABC transporter ATP-binding protein, partial [Aeromonas molluscorum]
LQTAQSVKAASKVPQATEPVAVASEPVKKTRKLSYKVQLELDELPAKLEQLEAELDTLQGEVNEPGFFSLSAEQTQQKLNALSAAEVALDQAFSRWEELEALKHQD